MYTYAKQKQTDSIYYVYYVRQVVYVKHKHYSNLTKS